MKRVKGQSRLRRLVLNTSISGGAFGGMGILKISNSIGLLISDPNILPISAALVGLVVFFFDFSATRSRHWFNTGLVIV